MFTVEEVHALEQQNLQQEISSLQTRVARIDELEKENAELRSKIERAAKRIRSPDSTQATLGQPKNVGSRLLPIESSPASFAHAQSEDLQKSLQENKKILQLLETQRAEVTRLYNANGRLQRRSRVLKERAKGWSEYHDRSLAKGRPTVANQRHVSDESIPSDRGRLLIPHSPRLPQLSSSLSEENPDTPKPETALPVLRLVSEQDTQNHEGGIAGISNLQAQDLHILGGAPQDVKSPPKEYPRIDKGNSSETCDEAYDQNRFPDLLRPWTHDTNDLLAAVLDDDESDVPVVISERSLKRKRPNDIDEQEVPVREGAEHQSGSAKKPFRVKSEHGSSSPVMDRGISALEHAHESLDLDEVGGRVLTPRKRRRLRRLKTASQSQIRRALSIPQQNGPERSMSIAARRRTSTEDFTESAADINLNSTSFLSREFCTEMATRIAREMCETLQSSLAETPRTHSSPRHSRLELQNLHNQRAHEREVRHLNEQSETVDHATDLLLAGIEGEAVAERARSAPVDVIGSETRKTGLDVDVGKSRFLPLHPKTTNARILPRTYDLPTTSKNNVSKQRKDQDRAQARDIHLTEDGEDDDAIHKAKSPLPKRLERDKSAEVDMTRAPKAVGTHYRLNDLLTEPSPEKPMLMSPNGPVSTTKPRNPSKTPLPREVLAINGDLSFSKEKKQKQGPASIARESAQHLTMTPMEVISVAQKHISEGTPGLLTPDDEPLRARPLHRLLLDDFKINPNHNQGMDFAFNEVVRNRDQRKCLPNCTKLGCCGGTFKKIVQMGGWTGPPTHGLWDSSPLDERDEEDRLLQEHLGISSASLSRMPESERATLLTEAKANKLANEYGRHRQNFERPPSPVGFWRTDMPTTQEAEADREEARKAERGKVEERWREALRGDGRWKFRDE